MFGAQAVSEFKITIDHELIPDIEEKEIAEIMRQMSVYGCLPVTINALSATGNAFAADS